MELFPKAYVQTVAGLTATDFSTAKGWDNVLKGLRSLAQLSGLDKGRRASLDALRKQVGTDSKSGRESDGIIAGAGKLGSNGSAIDDATAKKLGALKLLRHTYSLATWGSHKVWMVSTPAAMRNWPAEAYIGQPLADVRTSLDDTAEMFSGDDKRKLSKATQEGAAWCQKAMMVSAGCLTGKGKGIEIIKRWFADEDNQGAAELAAISATLNAGFKKMASAMTKGQVILTDVPDIRGDASSDIWLSEAAAAAGSGPRTGLRTVYIESAFFSGNNVLAGKKNWTRIMVHETSHVELTTDDHRYAHDPLGMKPERNFFSTATCLDNAESWAFFAADCAGALDSGTRSQVLK